MSNPSTSEETPGPATPRPTPPFRLRSRRKRSETIADPVSPVERDSTVVFEGSPSTIAASLSKAGIPSAALTWPAEGPGSDTAAGRETASPVFIVGGEPDGRDVLREFLDVHPNLSCGANSGLLAELARAVEDNWETALVFLGYPEQYWFRYVATYFESLRAAEARRAGKWRWVEFVGDADLSIETLDRLFPRARILHLVGGGLSFNRKARAVRHAADRLSAGRYLEVTGRELADDPVATAARIFAFLGEA